MKKKEILLEIITFLYVCLFLYAAGSKWMDFDRFQAQLHASPILTKFALTIAWGVPVIEIVIAIIIVIPRYRYAGLLLGYGLMLAFTVYIAALLTFSRDLPCSCGGILAMLGWKEHLIFNLVFVGLGIIGIFLSGNQPPKQASSRRNWQYIAGLSILGPAGILGLYLVSDPKLADKKGFNRLIRKEFTQQAGYIELENGTYYLAGSFNNRLYFATTANPKILLSTDTLLSDKLQINIQTQDNKSIAAHSTIQVDSAYFYIKDKENHALYQGKTGEWITHRMLGHAPYFTQATAISPACAIIVAVVNKKGTDVDQTVIGKVTERPDKLIWNFNLLKGQVDSLYSTLGILRYNRELHALVYTYNYRNQYLVIDTNLNLLNAGHTIDTIEHAHVAPKRLSNGHVTLASPKAVVNKNLEVYSRWMFVNSNIIANNDSKKLFDNSSVIDVYDLKNNQYRFSFYLPDYKGYKLRSLKIMANRLVALYGSFVVLYHYNELELMNYSNNTVNIKQG